MRLFVAIEIDAAARLAIADAQSRLRRRFGGRSGDPRWVHPDLMHVTLVFIGEADEARAGAVMRALATPLECCPFTLELGGLGIFPERGAPRVLWLGARSGAADAAALQRLVVDRLRPVAAVADESRPYHPHVTLARWRGRAPRSARDLAAGDGGVRAAVAVERAVLFASRQTAAGPAYTAMTYARLACP
jgi:2'-5' RNA ligase